MEKYKQNSWNENYVHQMHFRLNYNTNNLSLVLSYYRIYWVLCDGGEPNRSFVKLLYPYGSDPADHHFVADNLHTGRKIVKMADSKVKQRKYNEITLKWRQPA